MNSYNNCSDSAQLERQRQQLEALLNRFDPAEVRGWQQVRAIWSRQLSQAGQTLLSWLTVSREPRIRQRFHQGQPIWYVYDPVSESRHRFDAEADLRQWLDQRYYD